MRAFSVFGVTKSGKTTTIENIISELRRRGYSVGSVKEIHYESFAIDRQGTNTDRHRKAGSQLVTARGINETDILFQEMLPVEKILKFYDQDYVIFEGVTDSNIPKIICAHTSQEIDDRMDDMVFAISGRISNKMADYSGIPVISSIENVSGLVDLIEAKVFEKLPDFKPECCSACGFNCRELGIRILMGKSRRQDCIISKSNVYLSMDGKSIDMVPFVQKLLYNVIYGIVSELDGFKPDTPIEIKIGGLL